MADKEIQKIEKQLATNEVNKTYNSVIDFAKDLTCDPVLKTNCKLCKSQFRKEAEDMFSDGKSANWVAKWLKTKNEEISHNAVLNHLVQHFQKPARDLQLKNYAESLEDYCKIMATDVERLQLYQAVLDKQIHEVGSTIVNQDTEATRKAHETLVKLIDSSLKVSERIKGLRQENEPVRIVLQKVNDVLTVKYQEASTPEIRKFVEEIVDIIVKETEAMQNAIR